MTIMTPVRPAPAPEHTTRKTRTTLRDRLAERRMLARQARLTVRLIELLEIAALAERARAVVERGWVQRSWYRYQGPDQRSDQSVTGACLVGAIVHAGGGPKAFTSQLVQRTLDLTWNTLYGVDGDSLAWCPPPAVRISHARDLTHWNDQPTRTRGDVLDLLTATRAEAGRLSELIRARRNDI
jgi:hypothetical protein